MQAIVIVAAILVFSVATFLILNPMVLILLSLDRTSNN